MKSFVYRGIAASVVFGTLIGLLSCARDQQLTSIEVQPTTENFGAADPSLTVQLRALGHYIHPPVTKDITNQVTWASNSPGVAAVTSAGLLAPGGTACGNSLVTATVQTNSSVGGRDSSGALVTGSMTANVTCTTGAGGSGSGGGNGTSTLTVNFSGNGTGTIASSPTGLGCATTCSAPFTTGSPITLTATPNTGSTFGSWVGCDSIVGQTCTLALNASRTVTVVFN
jgi:Divergent InlB B-repeat domain